MTKISGAHVITRQPGLATPRAPTEPRSAEPPAFPVDQPDLAVIGGGAAGLAAASVAAEAGLNVLLIDERPVPGGQYYKQPVGRAGSDPRFRPDRQFRDGAALIARARRGGTRWLEGASVWGAFAPLELAVTSRAGGRIVRPARLIVATGAYERALPVPGWTLPGVMTTGAAQTLLRSHGVVAGRRVLLAGNGPLNLQVALELARAGATVVAVAELAPPPASPAAWLDMARADPGLLARGAGYLAGLRRRGIALLHRHCLARVEPAADGLRANLATWDGERLGPGPSFTVDAVTMGYGFLPSNDVPRALGAAMVFDPAQRQLRTVCDADGLTSVPNLYAAGDCRGLGGAQAARAEGVIAGLAAAASLGRAIPPALAAEGRRARSDLARHRRFQRGLWRLFTAADPASALATPDTLICRCEEVARARLDATAEGIGATKRLTRAGMGRCQGRYCAPALAAMIAARDGTPIDQDAFFAPRPPIKPVRIGDLIRPAAE
jgi:thioredoxin reductase